MTFDEPTQGGDAPDSPTEPTSGPSGSPTLAEPLAGLQPEHAAGGGSTEPARPARRFPVRWAVAIGATLLVLVAAVAFVFATQRASASPIVAYVPADAIAYAEARLDTPGDQGQALASFLSHFPGFADTSNLQAKLSDTWDRLIAGTTGDRYRYSTDVAPWAEGTVAMAVLPGSSGGTPQAILFVAVKDQAKAQAEIDKVVKDTSATGGSASQSQVGGVTVWTSASGTASVALLPSGMLIVASDKAAIGTVQDAKAGKTGNLGTAQAYLDATAGSAADRLGSLYVSTAGVQDQLRSLMPSIAPAAAACGGGTDPLAALPTSMFGTVRAESDRLVADFRIRSAAGTTAPSAHASTLVDHVPATTLAYVEVHDLGKTLSGAICGLKAGMGAAASQAPGASSAPTDQQLQQIEGVLGGPLESFVSWMGDAGLAVGAPTSGQAVPSVAFVASVADPALAGQRIGQLKGLLQLAGAFGGVEGLKVSDEQHGTATITTLSVPTSTVSGSSGSTTLPPSISVSWTLTGSSFVLALSPEAVGQFLDVSPAQSLGATPAFRDALAAAGGPSVTSIAYVDLRATRAALESAAPLPGTYATDVKPYLLPFDRLVAVGSVQGSTAVLRVVVTVSNPQ